MSSCSLVVSTRSSAAYWWRERLRTRRKATNASAAPVEAAAASTQAAAHARSDAPGRRAACKVPRQHGAQTATRATAQREQRRDSGRVEQQLVRHADGARVKAGDGEHLRTKLFGQASAQRSRRRRRTASRAATSSAPTKRSAGAPACVAASHSSASTAINERPALCAKLLTCQRRVCDDDRAHAPAPASRARRAAARAGRRRAVRRASIVADAAQAFGRDTRRVVATRSPRQPASRRASTSPFARCGAASAQTARRCHVSTESSAAARQRRTATLRCQSQATMSRASCSGSVAICVDGRR